jgi:hypothetical protein
MSTTEESASPARTRRVLCAGAITLALAACAHNEPPPPAPTPIVVAPIVHCDPPRDPQDAAARHFLATQDRLGTLNTADLAQEANHAIDPNSIEAAMDQALALSMTHAPGDIPRAQAVLDQVLHNNTPQADPYRSLARLLAYRLGEQRRAEEAADRAATQLRDQQRDSQRKLDALNDKLEALKAIERNLNTRPGTKAGG